MENLDNWSKNRNFVWQNIQIIIIKLLILQVEYAIEAIKLGSTVIGIQTSEGVVLAVEKRITSTLMIPSTIEKIVEIDKHIGKYNWFEIEKND